MAYKNAAFETAAYHLKCAVSYFGGTTWDLGTYSYGDLTLAYRKMCDTHLLLANAMLAEGTYEETRQLIEKTLPYVSSVPQDQAALLSVLAKSWIRER